MGKEETAGAKRSPLIYMSDSFWLLSHRIRGWQKMVDCAAHHFFHDELDLPPMSLSSKPFPSIDDGGSLNCLRTDVLRPSRMTRRPNGRHRSLQLSVTTHGGRDPVVHDDRIEIAAAEPEFLTVQELAAWIRVSPTSIYRLVDRRIIPFYRLQGVVRFRRSDIAAYFNARRVNVAGQ